MKEVEGGGGSLDRRVLRVWGIMHGIRVHFMCASAIHIRLLSQRAEFKIAS